MNSIFSAQKLVIGLTQRALQLLTSVQLDQRITIDVCKIFGADNVFLQQAAHLTGGAYVRVERTDGLLQYMMVRCTVVYNMRNHPSNSPVIDVVPASSSHQTTPISTYAR